MKRISSIALLFIVMVSSSWADISCPADSSFHVDMRTMLPDGSPNPTYGLEISTGLCACINFVDGVDITGSEITFTLNIVDNEPIRGTQIDIFHDAGNALSYEDGGNVLKGDKLDNLDDPTTSTVIESMTLLANEMDGFVRVMAYSTSRANTSGDGIEGNLFEIFQRNSV